MKVVLGDHTRILRGNPAIVDRLPASSYRVEFSKQEGFYLVPTTVERPAGKMYGRVEDNADVVLSAYERVRDRNFGALLSGAKGGGKTLTAKLIASAAMERGLPVIVCNDFVEGTESFINSIDQRAVVIIDELDKMFKGDGEDDRGILQMLDGCEGSNKLFVATCNGLYRINECLINRPGRFHYHFTYGYPSPEEAREYMYDNVPEHMRSEAEKIVDFSMVTPLTFDCLRAAAFELSVGVCASSAVERLNIADKDGLGDIKISIVLNDGTVVCGESCNEGESPNSYEMYAMFAHGKSVVSARWVVMTDAAPTIDGGKIRVGVSSIVSESHNSEKEDVLRGIIRARGGISHAEIVTLGSYVASRRRISMSMVV